MTGIYKPLHSRWKTLVFLVFGAFLLLVMGEVGIRAYDAIIVAPDKPYRVGMSFAPAPYTVHRNEPFFFHPALRTNSIGFRGPEFRTEAPSGTFRVVMLGGSAMFGFGSSGDDQTIPAQTERLLREQFPGRSIEVINAGQGSFNSTQEVILYETVITGMKPDLVVVMNGYNDFYHGLVTNRVPGMPTIWNDEGMQRALEAVIGTRLTMADVRRPVAKVLSKSALGYWLQHWYLRLERSVSEPASVQEASVDPNDELLAVYQRNVRHLLAVTKVDHVPVLFVVQPLAVDRVAPTPIERQAVNDTGKQAIHLLVMKYMDAAEQVLRDLSQSDDEQLLEIRPTVARAAGQMFIDPVHLTDEGNAVIAHLFADVIVRHIRSR